MLNSDASRVATPKRMNNKMQYLCILLFKRGDASQYLQWKFSKMTSMLAYSLGHLEKPRNFAKLVLFTPSCVE